jgi:hypothetical protein
MYLGHISSNDVWAGYLFLRLKMIEKELDIRINKTGLGDRYNSDDIVNPNDYTLQAVPNELIIRNEKNNLIRDWSKRMHEDGILELMDSLIPINSEDLWLESEWLIEMHRKEYGL